MQHPSTPLQRLNGERHNSFRAGHGTRPSRSESPFAGTMDQVRPLPTRSLREHANVDWSTYPFQPHQVAALRRPRTEARPRRADNAKGLTNRGPLQKGGQRRTCAVTTIKNFRTEWWARFALPTLRF